MIAQRYKDMLSGKSVIRQISEWSTARGTEIGYENVFDYSLGNPSVPCPEHFTKTCIDLLQTKEPVTLHGYSPTLTIPAVRKAVAESLNRRFGMDYGMEHIFMATGAAGALAHAMRCVAVPGQDIITFAPFFPEYTVFVHNANAKAVVLPPDTEHFQISLDALEKAITPHTRAIIINSPNNPSGVVYSADTYEKLAALLTRKSQEIGHPIYIISDEPYREIIYDGLPILYVPKFYKDTIICYSYSKSLSLPGERIGYVLVPDCAADAQEVYTAVCGAARSMGFVCAPHLFQDVVLKCLGQTGDMNIYDENCKLLYNGLREMGYDCVYPSGAFYLFVKSPEADAKAFSDKAKKLNLLIVPADSFGCPGYVRVSYCVDPDMIKRSFAAFKKLMEQYK